MLKLVYITTGEFVSMSTCDVAPRIIEVLAAFGALGSFITKIMKCTCTSFAMAIELLSVFWITFAHQGNQAVAVAQAFCIVDVHIRNLVASRDIVDYTLLDE